MKVIVVGDYEQMSRRAADIVADFVRGNPVATLGLPTGKTPKGMYKELIRKQRAGLDLSGVKTFNLDEYWGIPATHPASFSLYIDKFFLDHVNIPPRQVHRPEATGDGEEASRAYEDAIRRAGGLDMIILGIGANGHIGFNEPGTPFDTRTHVARLTDGTRRAATQGRGFSCLDEVPDRGITIGIRTVMEARRVVLLASGRTKAAAIAGAVLGPVTEQLPASVLQRHPNATFIVDSDAAMRLSAREA